MLLTRRKIPCYVLVFEQIDIIKRTLDFLTTFSDQLDIVVLENPSDNSHEIGSYLAQLGASKLIRRHYLFDENTTGGAFSVALNEEQKIIRKSKFVIITDGDITTLNRNWLDEELSILKKHKDVFACGITLDTANLPLKTFPESTGWIPDDEAEHTDYYQVYTGAHLLAMRGKELVDFLRWKNEKKLPFVDGTMHRYCTDTLHRHWARTKHAVGYHLTWDLYHDINHPYTQFKLSKSFDDTWYHEQTSGFTVTDYA